MLKQMGLGFCLSLSLGGCVEPLNSSNPFDSWEVSTPNPAYPYRLPAYTLHATAQENPAFQLKMLPGSALLNQWNLRAGKIDQIARLEPGTAEITVAVIDSGVDPKHPDLKNLLLPLEDIWDETVGIDQLKNRRAGLAIDFTGRDGNGHGTHVAGIIASTVQQGTALPQVKILPIKATSMEGTTSALILAAAIQRAIDRQARVINLSIGAAGDINSGEVEILRQMIALAESLGIVVISATGNESIRTPRRTQVSPVSIPAAFPEVIAVGALTAEGKVASYSNGGPELALLAPGGASSLQDVSQGIWSTWPTYRTYEYFRRNISSLNYAATSGTSMAAPHVSGVVALLLSREPQLTPAQVRLRLIATADDILEPGFDANSGYGKLNAHRALKWSRHDGG